MPAQKLPPYMRVPLPSNLKGAYVLDIRVLRVETCPSLSHRSTLTFQVGCRADGAVVLRLVANTAKGHFADDWVAWVDVLEHLPNGEPLSNSSLQPLFSGKSINTGGFLMAVLRHLGVVQGDVERGRGYVLADPKDFEMHARSLVASTISLGLDARPGSGKGKRKGIAMAAADGVALDS